MFKFNIKIVDIFYILVLILNIIMINNHIYSFYIKYGYDSFDIIEDKAHKYIYLKLTLIFISQFNYSFISLLILYFRYIEKNEKNEKKCIILNRVYDLIKKISLIICGTIMNEIFLKTSSHIPLRNELINLYSYIGNAIIMLYGSLYYQNKNYPLFIGYSYLNFPLIIKYFYEKNIISNIIFFLIINNIILYSLESKIILYINKLTNTIDNKDFIIINNKIIILNILYLCFDIIKQYLLYTIVYYY